MKKLLGMIAAAGVTGTVVALAVVTGVFAHAQYDSSTPSSGANVTTPPTSVVINFKENIQRTAGSFGVTVTKDGGGAVTSGPATVSGDSQLTVPLQSGLTAGRYVVNWNNTSEDDGDPLSGAFAFYVNTQPTSAQQSQDTQLASIEANALATATAEAASTGSSSALPKSGTGPSDGTSYEAWVIVGALAAMAAGAGALGLAYGRSRGRQ